MTRSAASSRFRPLSDAQDWFGYNVVVHIDGVPHLLVPDLRFHVEFLQQAAVFLLITLKFTHSRLTLFGCSAKCLRQHLRQQLSFRTGVVNFSEGKTQAAGEGFTDISRHSRMAERDPSEGAAHLTEYVDFGESISLDALLDVCALPRRSPKV